MYKEEKEGEERIVSTVPFVLNSKQLKHATLILKRVPELSKLRNILCPKAMDDDIFWRIYFSLIRNQIKDALKSEEVDNEGWKKLAQTNKDHKKEEKYGGVDWNNTILSSHSNLDRQELLCLLKHLSKLGVPDSQRAAFWMLASGAGEFEAKFPLFFQESIEQIFGYKFPSKFAQTPDFGAKLKPSNLKSLSDEQIFSAQKLLVMLKMEYDSFLFVPFLPNLVLVLLHCLKEHEVYTICHLLLSPEKNTENWIFFGTKKLHYAKMMHAFGMLVQSFFPILFEHMKSLKVLPEQFAKKWFTRFFVGALPIDSVLKITDNFLLEGKKFLYKTGLAILYSNMGTLLQCKSKEELLNSVVYLTRHSDTPAALLTISSAMKVSNKQILQLEKE